jgi:hypothetical protein
MKPIPPGDSAQITWSRPEKSIFPFLLRESLTNKLSHRLGGCSGLLSTGAPHLQPKCHRKGRIAKAAANGQLVLGEPEIVVIGCSHNGRMIGTKRLNYYPTRFFPSSCPSGYLGEKLKCSLRRPKVRHMKG